MEKERGEDDESKNRGLDVNSDIKKSCVMWEIQLEKIKINTKVSIIQSFNLCIYFKITYLYIFPYSN